MRGLGPGRTTGTMNGVRPDWKQIKLWQNVSSKGWRNNGNNNSSYTCGRHFTTRLSWPERLMKVQSIPVYTNGDGLNPLNDSTLRWKRRWSRPRTILIRFGERLSRWEALPLFREQRNRGSEQRGAEPAPCIQQFVTESSRSRNIPAITFCYTIWL